MRVHSRWAARLRCEELEARETPAVVAGFTESVLASGLVQPTAMALAPDGRIFVAEKAGALRVVQNGSVLATPFLTVGVDTASERGLIGVALDPNFAANNFIYVYYTTSGTLVNRVSRFVANGNTAAGPETILLDNIPSTNGNHNGGALVFGADGKLYVGVGDAGVSSNSQSLTNVSGKVLRINSDGTIPSDNPFFGTATGDNRAIYALGLRNPFTMAVQPGTGRLLINDVGGTQFEEVNQGAVGANYGWPTTEGDFDPAALPGFTRPVYAYAHGSGPLQGNSIAGGAFYNPTTASFPGAFVGDYYFADFVSSRIFLRDESSGAVTTFADPTAGSGVVDLDVLPDGRLLYLSLNTGRIYQIAATGPTAPAQLIAVGTGPGVASRIAALSADGTTRFTVTAYAGYSGGVRVASGDVTGDGVEDVVAGTAPGAPPHVKVFDGATGGLVRSFLAFDPAFLGGLFVASGDVNGDGRADIIVGTATGASHVKAFDGVTGAVIRSFLAYDGFTGGVTVATGDANGDGRVDIITGTATSGAHIKVFDGASGALLNSFFAFSGFGGGVSVGFASGSVVVGATAGPPHVKTFVGGAEQGSFYAFDPAFQGGVRVAGNGALILAGAGAGAGPHLKGFSVTLVESLNLFAFDPAGTGGIFVG
ncbi:PQQ-dependent sugar dehydrogenase [Gemmata sp. G18]|uniref:PQQ-dependent sugar dehydrogenase n=1 Tax=Gemmata palustris TaxID=2822762 RepID=A0ABS5BT07_9BACT|nr:PQQ-dependent sugar dehydrogenase [Gemmata palustris]MBP3956867.1 PQQ-dependent sugar dehydrogenase [Gemmata palustris]